MESVQLAILTMLATMVHTEVSNEGCLCGVWGPLPVSDISVLADIEPKFLVALNDD